MRSEDSGVFGMFALNFNCAKKENIGGKVLVLDV